MFPQKYINFIIIYQIFLLQSISPAYKPNPNGKSCKDAPRNPIDEESCTSYHTNDTACCFAEIELQNRTFVQKCIPIAKNLRFALNSLTIFSFKDFDNVEYEDVVADFKCGQKDMLCGTNSPDKIFQCSEHSSRDKSCCYLETPTYTECVLSDMKYNESTTFTLFETSSLICFGDGLRIKLFFFILLIFLI